MEEEVNLKGIREIRESHAVSQTASFYKVTKLQDIFHFCSMLKD